LAAKGSGYIAAVRVFGALLVLAAAFLGSIGAAWTTFATIGTEWDYCPSGSDCIAGELAGLTLVAIAVLAAWVGFRLARTL
jgi:hypothetical protein